MSVVSTRPLAGIRVLDLTTSLAGPFCSQILGILGAAIVKIERPGSGDDTRAWGPPFWGNESAMFLATNGSKRSLALDIKTPAGREVLLRLAESADVFLENLRPGAARRLGLGFEALRERNHQIVYCSISAFGTVGPHAERPGYDPLMQAMSGIMSVTGEPGRPPVRAGVSVVDQGSGMWAVIGILAALRTREIDGHAHLVETSLFETALNWLPYHVLGYLATSAVPGPQGSAVGMISPYEAFETRDGHVMIAAGNDRHFAALCRALELHQVVNDPRFHTNRDRVAHRDELRRLIQERVAFDSTENCVKILEQAAVPVARVQDVQQAVEDPQTQALDLLEPMPHPNIPDLRLLRPPLTIDGIRARHSSPPPALGVHSAEVLEEAGYRPEEIDKLARAGVIEIAPRPVAHAGPSG